MNKPWLLIVNDCIAGPGVEDWYKRFNTEQEAQQYLTTHYHIQIKYDGFDYTIVNLETWGMDE